MLHVSKYLANYAGSRTKKHVAVPWCSLQLRMAGALYQANMSCTSCSKLVLKDGRAARNPIYNRTLGSRRFLHQHFPIISAVQELAAAERQVSELKLQESDLELQVEEFQAAQHLGYGWVWGIDRWRQRDALKFR